MLYTIENRDSIKREIVKGSTTSRGPLWTTPVNSYCVVISGDIKDPMAPPLARFLSDSNILIKALRVTFPGAAGLRPAPVKNSISFIFHPKTADGLPVPGMAQKVATVRVDSFFWEWLEIPQMELPAFAGGYWEAEASYYLNPDFLGVIDDYIGGKCDIRIGALIESSLGVFGNV